MSVKKKNLASEFFGLWSFLGQKPSIKLTPQRTVATSDALICNHSVIKPIFTMLPLNNHASHSENLHVESADSLIGQRYRQNASASNWPSGDFDHSAQEVTVFYELMRNYWNELSGFAAIEPTVMLNFGYWPDGTLNLHDAQLALVRKIVSALSSLNVHGQGLEIGCGIGGVSIGVLQELQHVHLTGLDISEKQLSLAQRNARNSGLQNRFTPQQGDSMDLPFVEAQFDFCLCIESSFHYIDKRSFFEECFRTLKPGGVGIVADITCSNQEGVGFRHGNYFEGVQKYRELIDASGFCLLSEEDIGAQVYMPLYQHVLAFNGHRRNQVARYWSRVLRNYLQLAQAGEMGYHIFCVQKPGDKKIAS